MGLRATPAALEVELSPLIAGAQHVPQLRPLPRFPSVVRDLSLVVPEKTRYAQLELAIRELKLDHLEAIDYVTTYRGKPLEKGNKSITIALVFRSATGTLTGTEVDTSVQRVVSKTAEALAATVRV